MTREDFLHILAEGLTGLPSAEIDDILSDYSAHFEEARASGRSEREVAAALGDPRRLARELRAETGLRRWENHHSFRNSTAALFALSGLAVVDIVLMLPLLLAVLLILLVIAFVMCILGIIGIGLLISVYKHFGDGHIANLILRGLAGIALLTTGAGSARCWRLGSIPPSDGSATTRGCTTGCSSRSGTKSEIQLASAFALTTSANDLKNSPASFVAVELISRAPSWASLPPICASTS